MLSKADFSGSSILSGLNSALSEIVFPASQGETSQPDSFLDRLRARRAANRKHVDQLNNVILGTR